MSKPAESILSAYSFISTTTLDKILSFGHRFKNGKPIPSFDENLLLDLCNDAQQIFMKEKNLLEINGNLTIIGDIHGNLFDLIRILKHTHNSRSKVLFLGDYVDIGEFSLECITLLFAMKITHPDSFFLIRGDHEFNSVCSVNGFKNEIINDDLPTENSETTNPDQNKNTDQSSSFTKSSISYKYTEKLYTSILKVFSYLPIAAIVNNTTFCVHGGLSPKLHHVDTLNKLIQRPIYFFEDNLLVSDLVNGDPSDNSRGMFIKNPSGRGYLFNQESISIFLRDNSLTRIIRSHQKIQNGSMRSFNDRCITVYSASSYDKFENISSAIIELFQKNDAFRITTFFPIRRFSRKDAVFYKVPYVKKIEKKILLSISLLQPQSFANIQSQNTTSRDSDQISSQRAKVCASSRLRFNNPLKSKILANQQKKMSNLAKKAFLHESFSADFIEEDDY